MLSPLQRKANVPEGPELEKIRILGKAISFYSNIK